MSINLKKYKLSPEDQNILNLKYIDFTSDNPDLIDFEIKAMPIMEP